MSGHRTTKWLPTLMAVLIAACNRAPASRDMAALDRAYQAGVITKAEYEMKRSALETQSSALAALDKALEAGVLRKEEYQARKAQLLAKSGALAALERAYASGVLNKEEYLAKKSSLLAPDAPVPASPPAQEMAPPPLVAAADAAPVPAGVPASTTGSAPLLNASQQNPLPPRPAGARTEEHAPIPAAQPQSQPQSAPAQIPVAEVRQASAAPQAQVATAQGHVLRMKVARAVDQSGFERPMTSATMLVPTDWQVQGGTVWNIKDKCNGIQTNLRTFGPDGRAIEVFPAFNWMWADDPKPLQMTAAQTAQYGSRPCDVMPPLQAADFLRRNLNRYRPNAQVVGLEPAPKLLAIMQQMARDTEQSGLRYNLRQSVRPDAIKARVRYNLNGQAMEEWIVVAVMITGTLGPSYNTKTMQPGQAWTYNCAAYVTGERAPQGQLDANEKFFDLVVSTYRRDPQWQARVDGNAQAIQQIELKGVRDRSAIVAKNADDIRNIQREGYEGRQRTMDQISNQRSQTMRGVETYRNPATGETVELSNQYGHAWVNNRGEYLLSDQPGFDPVVTLKEDWKPLEHVKQ